MKTPEFIFHSIVISLTTLIIFSIWTLITDHIEQNPLLSIMFSGIISLGFYRFIYTILLIIFRKLKCFKKLILQSSYIEGTWVGFFIDNQNKPKFFVEIFEQDLSELIIKGKSFYDSGSYQGTWISDNVAINSRLGEMTYTYKASMIGNTFVNPGIAHFDFERKSKFSPPEKMIGFSSDLFNPKKLKAFELKISDKSELDHVKCYQKAQEIYNQYKDNI